MSQPVESGGFGAYFDAWEARIGSFLEVDRDKLVSLVPLTAPTGDRAPTAEMKTAGNLAGLPFGVKDNIALAGAQLTCGSRLLDGFVSPYTATAVGRLMDAGAYPVGKTNLDEFGMGSSTDNSAYKKTNNPWDSARVAGGSSGGSAAAVAAGLVPFALGSDTGGSVRQPANFCGVVGLKPTYGAVSRFGLVAYASSLETIGVLAGSVSLARDVFSVMRATDPLDQTTIACPDDAPALVSPGESRVRPFTIGVLKPSTVADILENTGTRVLEHEVEAAFSDVMDELKVQGHRLVDLQLPTLRYAVPAYYTIAMAEASANLARFDGIRYGNRPSYSGNPEELIDGTREAGFGDEVKLRILLGTFVLRSGFQDRYYLQAQKIRHGIRLDFERALDRVDAILMPVFPSRAFGRGDAGLSPFAQKAADIFTVAANLAGLPALAFPTGVSDRLPVGVQLMGRAFSEGLLLEIAEGWERSHPVSHPEGFEQYWGGR